MCSMEDNVDMDSAPEAEMLSVEDHVNETVMDDDDHKSSLFDDMLFDTQRQLDTACDEIDQRVVDAENSDEGHSYRSVVAGSRSNMATNGELDCTDHRPHSVLTAQNRRFQPDAFLALKNLAHAYPGGSCLQTPATEVDLFELPSDALSVDTTKSETISQLSGSKDQPAPVPVVYTSVWSDYLRERINRIAYPAQKAAAARRRFLHEVVKEDHCYDAGQTSGAPKPAISPPSRLLKTIFHVNEAFSTICEGSGPDDDSTDSSVDVELPDVSPPVTLPYDRQKALSIMREMEEFMTEIRRNPDGTIQQNKFDEEFSKTYSRRGAWTARQRSIFDMCTKIFSNEHCLRLSVIDHPDEPITRRISLDRSASRFRKMMANIQWNGRLVYWLHAVLIDGLNPTHLAIYFEILQTLVEKIPEHVNSLFNYMLPTPAGPASDLLMKMLEHPWDPVGKSVVHFDKLPSLTRSPLFIIAPHPYGHGQENLSSSRMKIISRFLTQLGRVVQVDAGSSMDYTAADLYKNMLITLRNTVVEMQKRHPDEPVILVGMGIGSMVACQVSLVEPCAAIICFGFPLKTPKGMHGDYGDPLLKLETSLQFFIGLDTYNCPLHEFLEFREKLLCDTDVVCAAGCDDYLRMKSFAKQSLKMTQSMVDRCFLEEVVPFVHRVIQKAQPRRVEVIVPDPVKKRKAKVGVVRESTKKTKTVANPSSKVPARMARKLQESFSESNTSSQDASTMGSSTPSSTDTAPTETLPPDDAAASFGPLPSIGISHSGSRDQNLQWFNSPTPVVRPAVPTNSSESNEMLSGSDVRSSSTHHPGSRLSVITHTGPPVSVYDSHLPGASVELQVGPAKPDQTKADIHPVRYTYS